VHGGRAIAELIDAVRAVELPSLIDHRGALTFVEAQGACPFEVRRVYWLYDAPTGVMRGGHAHRETEAMIIPVAGQFDVLVDDGVHRHSVVLARPVDALYLGRMIWREISAFSPGAVALLLASTPYDHRDYIHDYEHFREMTSNPPKVVRT
jgi:dTDP-4-dehydrorhamnose 3,5-epimerase-like enzyme